MVTGKKAFEGKSRVLLMSAIATHTPPPLATADPSTPPELEHIVATCLAKDPADRWQSARDVLAELQAIAEGGTDGDTTIATAIPRKVGRRRAIAAGTFALAIAVAAPGLWYLRGEAAPAELRYRVPMQLTALPGPVGVAGVASGALFGLASFAVSPDGNSLAFVARATANDPFNLYVRPLNALVPQLLTAVEDAAARPFWSADGRSIGFVAGGRLRKIAASGGPPQDLAETDSFFGGAWNQAGVIIFGTSKGIFRVAAEGGTPEIVTTPEATESGHYWPSFLPDGRHFLYSAWSSDAAHRVVYAASLDSKDKTRILPVESNAAYSLTGHLLFHRGKAMYAQLFDPKTLTLSGDEARVADEVSFAENTGRGHFSVSTTGVLAYFENSGTTGNTGALSEGAEWHLAWVGRTGQVGERPGPPGAYRGVEVSPDLKRIAVHRHEPSGGDIWIIEPSGSETRLTFDASQHNSSPIWSPDGRDVVYSSLRGGKWGLYRKRSDGSSTEELLFESDAAKAAQSWSPDGARIVFSIQDAKTKDDLWVLSLADKKAAPLANTPFIETHAQISPDGKWFAYSSDVVGNRREIHIRPFPSGTGQWQISVAGGDWPRWRHDGKELYYHSIGSTTAPQVTAGVVFIGPLYGVTVNGAGSSFEHGAAKPIINFGALNHPHLGVDYHAYALSPDGEQFLYYQYVPPTATSAQATGIDHPNGLVVAVNWAEGLKK
jgi:Tol biopolymer transport system component